MVSTDLTEREIAEKVREAFNASRTPDALFGPGLRLSRRTDEAIKAVATELGLDWRPVLRAYRRVYPLPPDMMRRYGF